MRICYHLAGGARSGCARNVGNVVNSKHLCYLYFQFWPTLNVGGHKLPFFSTRKMHFVSSASQNPSRTMNWPVLATDLLVSLQYPGRIEENKKVLIKIDLQVRQNVILSAHETIDVPFKGIVIWSIRKKECSKRDMHNCEFHACSFEDSRWDSIDRSSLMGSASCISTWMDKKMYIIWFYWQNLYKNWKIMKLILSSIHSLLAQLTNMMAWWWHDQCTM